MMPPSPDLRHRDRPDIPGCRWTENFSTAGSRNPENTA